MNIHEYQAKEILNRYGIPVPKGHLARTPEEATVAAEATGSNSWVVKAQIHAGGRGKAGGIIKAHSLAEVQKAARTLLNQNLVTHQTGPKGERVRCVYIEETCQIEKELYLGLVLDRSHACLSFIASAAGGTDIEEIAKNSPEKIIKLLIESSAGVHEDQIQGFCQSLKVHDKIDQFKDLLQNLYKAYLETDASLIEINPLVITKGGDLKALDAKISFDDNALFRHPEIKALRDEDDEDPLEKEAGEHDLNYVKLDGNIGCMVNGAGLAMATMDIIQLHGAKPANFLDVGGDADQKKVEVAFKLISKDPNVKAILINIFGGIMKCDTMAEGIVAAAKELKLKIPIVVRLQGTHKDLGQKILASSNLPIITANNLEEAAVKALEAAYL